MPTLSLRGRMAAAFWALGGLIAMSLAPPARAAQIELFEQDRFGGNALRLETAIGDVVSISFERRMRSAIVIDGRWELCTATQYRGNCLVLGPGRYEQLPEGWRGQVASVRPRPGDAPAGPVATQPWPVGPTSPAAVVLYQDAGFTGRRVEITGAARGLSALDFNDEASSIVIQRGRWQLCRDADFRGSCIVMGPGRHGMPDGWNDELSSLRPVFGPGDQPLPALGGVTLYDRSDFSGTELTVTAPMPGLGDVNFSDRAASIEVHGGTWELCADSLYRGACVVFGPGRHVLPGSLNDRVTSLRPARTESIR